MVWWVNSNHWSTSGRIKPVEALTWWDFTELEVESYISSFIDIYTILSLAESQMKKIRSSILTSMLRWSLSQCCWKHRLSRRYLVRQKMVPFGCSSMLDSSLADLACKINTKVTVYDQIFSLKKSSKIGLINHCLSHNRSQHHRHSTGSSNCCPQSLQTPHLPSAKFHILNISHQKQTKSSL